MAGDGTVASASRRPGQCRKLSARLAWPVLAAVTESSGRCGITAVPPQRRRISRCSPSSPFSDMPRNVGILRSSKSRPGGTTWFVSPLAVAVPVMTMSPEYLSRANTEGVVRHGGCPSRRHAGSFAGSARRNRRRRRPPGRRITGRAESPTAVNAAERSVELKTVSSVPRPRGAQWGTRRAGKLFLNGRVA